jgi:hypothetical protein
MKDPAGIKTNFMPIELVNVLLLGVLSPATASCETRLMSNDKTETKIMVPTCFTRASDPRCQTEGVPENRIRRLASFHP